MKINKTTKCYITCIIYYIIFYMVYIVGPLTPSKIVLWKYYFPIKVLPLFLAIIWGNIHNDVREMLTYMRKDEEKTQRLKKRFLIKNSLIFLIGSFLLIFIMPFVILFFKNEFGINILFLLSN